MNDRSSATGPKRSGGTKRRTKLTTGSVIAKMNSAMAKTIPFGRQEEAKIRT
jgi:hypothetical protein